MNITIATSIKYGNYKSLQLNADNVKRLVVANVPKIKKLFGWGKLNLSDVEVRIRPIKGGTRGLVRSKRGSDGVIRCARIEIDPRILSDKDGKLQLLDTLTHELCHMWQYHTKTLSWQSVHRTVLYDWKGTTYRDATTHQAYLNLPWEIEAREHGKKFVEWYKESK